MMSCSSVMKHMFNFFFSFHWFHRKLRPHRSLRTIQAHQSIFHIVTEIHQHEFATASKLSPDFCAAYIYDVVQFVRVKGVSI